MIPSNNINDPDYIEPNHYQEQNEKEAEKLAVDFLAHIDKTQRRRRSRLTWTFILLLILIGIAPSTMTSEYCTRCGLWRSHNTLAWGMIPVMGIPRETQWSQWYYSFEPEPHDHNFVTAGVKKQGFMTLIAFPWGIDLGWEFPVNLVGRMNELTDELQRGRVLEIPRTLGAVKNAREWNAIIVPLTLGTPRDAARWWDDQKDYLTEWAHNSPDSPLSEEYIGEADEYIREMAKPEGNIIPIL